MRIFIRWRSWMDFCEAFMVLHYSASLTVLDYAQNQLGYIHVHVSP